MEREPETEILLKSEDAEALSQALGRYNEAYRRGQPLIPDTAYDRLVERLRELAPAHPYLTEVEPEVFPSRREVRHPEAMLSIDKAYTAESLGRFISRVEKAAGEIAAGEPQFRVTPKLDGLAGRDDGRVLATRGNGIVGYDVSHVFDLGVVAVGGRGRGLGEIVVARSYFDRNLSGEFVHPRNMCVGIVSADVINDPARRALEDGAVRFVPYSQLATWQGDGRELLAQIDEITNTLGSQTDYPIDGMVAAAADPVLRAHMGATARHYRWQVAIKTRGQTAVTTVQAIQWQVGRTGSVTPVLEVAPVLLSGATIRRVTAHHAGMVRDRRVGPGARIEIIRSGEVIPKLEAVVAPSKSVDIPDCCPACSRPLDWQNDFLKCVNPGCRAQIEQRLAHWFRILGNADWFGIKTITRLVAAGYDSLEKVYDLGEEDFVGLGFGPVQSRNLAAALAQSRSKPVEDWRFLAALGISDLGTGDSRKLLAQFRLRDLAGVTADEIGAVHGFGDVTSRNIAAGIAKLRATLEHLLALGFSLEPTLLAADADEPASPIAGKGVVFTGKMVRGSREAMQDEARRLGAKVQTAVSGRTDLLVCGQKVGNKKLEKARRLGVSILTEDEYIALAEAPH